MQALKLDTFSATQRNRKGEIMQQTFHNWINSLVRFGDSPNNYIVWRIDQLQENINADGDSEYNGLVNIYTRTHSYCIKAKVQTNQPSYLGCVASTRKPLAGEAHTRGNDLADGYFTEATWLKIVTDILRYELVKIVKASRREDNVVK
jgi:hypothetical protein